MKHRKERKYESEPRSRERNKEFVVPIKGRVQVEPARTGELVWGDAESSGVVVQGGVYAERGAP